MKQRSLRQPIFVGDVQGCADELAELLERAERRFGDEFTLHVVGDLVNRGPSNLEALEAVRTLMDAGRGSYVLGNHEIALLQVAFGLREASERDTFGEVLDSAECDDWIEWIRGRPLAESGKLAGQQFVMVHASVHPDWTRADVAKRAARIERLLGADDVDDAVELLSTPRETARPGSVADDLGRLVSCRSVEVGGGWSSRPADLPRDAWHAQWSRRRHIYGVVYGHWALQGLHVVRGLRGLDTGCVHHGRGRAGFLTAWLPDVDRRSDGRATFDVPDDRLWQIPARRRYYQYD